MGIIQKQRGLNEMPPHVRGITSRAVQFDPAQVIKLHTNENQLGASPRAVAALAAALTDINFYPDPDACSLRETLAAHLSVLPEQLRVGNGADGLIREICEAYLEESDEVIVSQATFPNYDAGTHLMRARLIKTPLRDYRLDLPAMLSAITDRTKIIFVCNPNNPTGTIVTAAELDAFIAQVPDRILVVVDEAYYEFVDSPDFPDSLAYVRAGSPNVLVMRTFSKVYGIAGIRLGYVVARPDILEPLQQASDSFPVNRLAQVAGEAALGDLEFVARTVTSNWEGRRYLQGEFARMGLMCLPSHTNFVLVEIGPEAPRVFESLRQQGIMVRPCQGYGLPTFLRITIGTAPQNQRVIDAIEQAL